MSLSARFHVWVHETWRNHTVTDTRVSAPQWDPFARGVLYRCLDCRWTWAD